MNAINVVRKTVVLVPAKTTEISSVAWRTLDDSFGRRLRIHVLGGPVITIEGDAYDALGQWTDDTIKQIVLTRLELVEAV